MAKGYTSNAALVKKYAPKATKPKKISKPKKK